MFGNSEFSGAGSSVFVNQYLAMWGPAGFSARIGSIQCYAGIAGSGTGNTVIDVLLNGKSIWIRPGDRPTLPATSTGPFILAQPTVKTLKAGDILDIQVAQVPTGTGPKLVRATLTIEKPYGSMTGTG